MKNSWLVIGLMSGTSVDGLDIAAVRFTGQLPAAKFEIIHSETISYRSELAEQLYTAPELSATELIKFDREYGRWTGSQVAKFCAKHQLKPDIVASHGHTVYHKPEEGINLQIGNPAEIRNQCGFPVVGDFRTEDVLLGGQGAPLVPIGDKYLFSEYDVCLNIGGFANLSYEFNGERIAFDVCPANIVLNNYARILGEEYDQDGLLARRGNVVIDLKSKLDKLEFYSQKPPKSLAKEWLDSEFLPLIDSTIASLDILATLTVHIADQITNVLNATTAKSVLITGGGAYNKYLIELISERSKPDVIVPEGHLVEYKEALIFAFLGLLRIEGHNNILSSVTGASKDHSSGIIYP